MTVLISVAKQRKSSEKTNTRARQKVILLLKLVTLTVTGSVILAMVIPRLHAASTCDSASVRCVYGPVDSYTSIQGAVNAAAPGDTVLIYPHPSGTYVLPSGSGQITVTTPSVTVQGVNRDTVVIDGGNLPYDSNGKGNVIMVDGWEDGDADGVIVKNLTLKNGQRSGVRVSLADNVIIRNLKVLDSVRFGIFSDYAENIIVEDTIVDGTAIEDLIYLSNSADRPIVRRNTLTNSAETAIQLNGDCRSSQSRYTGTVDGMISDGLIEGNLAYGNDLKTFSIISAPRTRIQNNIIYDNGKVAGAAGIHLTDEPGCGKPSDESVVVNNTIVEPSMAAIRITDGVKNSVIFNNIAARIGGTAIVDEVGGNFIDTLSNHRLSSVGGYFVAYSNNGNPSDDNLHLRAGSPAINAQGKTMYQGKAAPGKDIDGGTRNTPYDIGADEYGSGSSSPLASAVKARYWFFAYAEHLRGGYQVSAGNVVGDGEEEIVFGTEEGFGPHVRVFTKRGNLKASFFAFDERLRNGVTVSACDVDGDGYDEIVTAQGAGALPEIRIFEASGKLKNKFMALDGRFQGGVNVSCGDLDGDGVSEAVVAAQTGGGPHVMVFSLEGTPQVNFFAYDQNFRGGINVTTIDMNGDGRDEIVTGPQVGAPHIQIFQIFPDRIKRVSPGFYAFSSGYRGGVDVDGADIDGDGRKEILVGAGLNHEPRVKIFNNKEQQLKEFLAFNPWAHVGVHVAGGDVDNDGIDEIMVVPRANGGPHVRVIEPARL